MILSLALAALATPALQQEAPPQPWWDGQVEAALERAGERRAAWEAEARGVPQEARAGFAYLLAHMPQRDLDALDPAFVTENVALALRARAAVPWGAELPEDVFLDAVLPYANVSEPRDPWRAEFLERFLPLVQDCATPGEAARKLNGTVFGQLGVRYSTGRKRADQSPKESIEQGKASCTGLSIVLADACRAVCVPARLAGIARWPNKEGNHTWVEVWDGGWHFTGAAEPDRRGLDHAWFTGDAALATPGDPWNGIWAVSWRPTGATFPLVFAPETTAHAVDVTARYLPAPRPEPTTERARLFVEVLDGARRVAAPVRVTGGAAPLEGESHDDSHDTNDLLEFAVPRGVALEVAVGVDGAWVPSARLTLADEPQRILRLRRPASAAAAAAPAAVSAGALLREEAWRAYAARDDHAARRADFEARVVRTADRQSPYTLREVGQRPEGGWGLVIAMHGGGGVPPEVNDSQWRHMQVYYKDHPEHGGYLYCALRAPNDVWNGFYDDAIAPLVEELVRQMVLCADVDPDRVHLIGYSHGGYGAFVIGTKIPDRFATVHASAAAPTGGETAAENLRATRFSFMVGEKDTAYGRRARCEQFDARITELRGGRDDVYPVEFLYQPGHGHGGLPDRDLLERQLAHRRDPAPRELSWRMTDGVLRDFFWLSCDAPREGGRIDAVCRDNTVELNAAGVERLTVWLDERLVDLDRPVTVVLNGAAREVTLAPDAATLAACLERRGDPRLAFAARVDVELAPPEAGAGAQDEE